MSLDKRQRRRWRLLIHVACGLLLLLGSAMSTQVVAQSLMRLVPLRGGSKVRLIYKKRAVVVNMEEEVRDTLPGNEPHRYKTLLTAAKDGTLFMLVRVCSGSPISNPNAPCGGDSPCALLWIKANEKLANREIKSEIYASCSYNYYVVGAPRIARGKLTVVYQKGVDFGDKVELSYDNQHPERGIVLKEL
jgi:hypothetical protein